MPEPRLEVIPFGQGITIQTDVVVESAEELGEVLMQNYPREVVVAFHEAMEKAMEAGGGTIIFHGRTGHVEFNLGDGSQKPGSA